MKQCKGLCFGWRGGGKVLLALPAQGPLGMAPWAQAWASEDLGG